MGKAYAAITACILFFYLLSRINVYICLIYRRNGNDDHIAVEVRMLGKLILYSIKVPVIEITSQDVTWFISEVGTDKEKTKTHPKREQRFLRRVVQLYINHPKRIRKLMRIMRYYKMLYRNYMDHIVSGVTCEVFHWRTAFGSEDAAVTALSTGILWAIKGVVLTRIRRQIPFTTRPVIQVAPAFGVSKFETELKCIFRVRLGHVINATTRLITTNRKEAVNRV